MQDNNIKYQLVVEGAEGAVAKFQLVGAAAKQAAAAVNQASTAAGGGSGKIDRLTNATDKNASSTNRAAKAHQNYFAHIAQTTVQSALVNKAFLGITEAAGNAVKQVDLFNNFPATMQAMGVSVKDSSASFQTLKNYVAGVGGDLSQAATSVTRFTEVTRNVKAATAEFVGVNNALIAGGAGAEVQKNALEQLTQAYSRGKPQLIEWRSLMVAMPLQLSLVAHAMKLPNANALGEALTNGKVSMQAFMTELTKLGTGSGQIAQQAIARMQGIEFATNIMKNALTNGLAAIYQAFGRNNIIAIFNFLTQVIIALSGFVVDLINNMITLFNIISKVFGGPQIAHFTGEAQGAAGALTDGSKSAGDMADGLGDAADEAKKINKSLASFDKMNVLPDKTSGKDKKDKGSGTTGPLDAATAGELTGVFDNITGKIAQAGLAAKIFAGVLAGLATLKFASIIADQFNGIVNSIRDAQNNVKSFKDTLTGGKEGENIFAKAKGSALALGTSIGTLVASFGKALLNPWVLLAAAIAALVAGIIYLYNTNEDFRKGFNAAWSVFPATIGIVTKAVQGFIDGAMKRLQKAVSGLPGPIQDALKAIGGAFEKVGKFFTDLAHSIGLTGPPMELLGKVAGGLAVAIAAIGTAILIYDGIVIAANVATWAFAGAIAIITSPITLVIAAIAAVIAIIVLLVTHWSDVKKAAQWAWEGIVSTWNGVGKWFDTNVGKPVAKFFTGMWDDIKATLGQVGNFFKDIFKGAVDGIGAVFKGIGQVLLAIFVVELAVLLTIFEPVINGASIAIKAIFGVFAAIGVWMYDNVVKPLVDMYIGLWQKIISIFIDVGKWFGARFQEAYNAVIAIWTVFDTWMDTNVWAPVKAIFVGVGMWFGARFQEAWNAVIAIWIAAGTWFNTNVWTPIKNLFIGTGTFFGGVFTDAWNRIVAIWNGVAGWFGGVWNGIKGVFGTVAGFFAGVFQGAWNNIVNIFGNIGGWFSNNVVRPITNAFSSIGSAIAGSFKGAMNGIVDLINNFIRSINTNIDKINGALHTSVGHIPNVPRLAKGGVVTQPTMALVGEQGKEVVMPLENNTGWIDELAAKINTSSTSNDSQPISLTIQIGEEKIVTKVIELINEKTQMSGRNAIIV